MDGFQFDPFGQLVSSDINNMQGWLQNFQQGAPLVGQMNPVPPIPGVTVPAPLPIPQNPESVLAGLNLANAAAPAAEAEKGTGNAVGDVAKKAAKAAGNLTPQQAQALGNLMGQGPVRSNPGAPSAAVPRGPQGNMQQLTMGTPRVRQTLSQLIYGR
jgi:hypothetical protein